MEARDFLQLVLLASGGEIQGKTKLQKTVYLLGIMSGQLEDLGYRPHYYGPYSDEVAAAVAWLKTIGVVEQFSSGVGSTDPSGFEIRRYDYRLSERGRKFAETTARDYPDVMQRVRESADLLRRTGDLDYMKMSIVAKTYFMLGESGHQASEEDLARLAKRFGWEVTPEQVKEAAHYLESLGLVEITAD
jgi:uncharacterized protein YwgA